MARGPKVRYERMPVEAVQELRIQFAEMHETIEHLKKVQNSARELAQMILTLSKEDFTLEFGLGQKRIASQAREVLRLMGGG